MQQHIALTALLVGDYDDAIAFYTGILGFQLIEDTRLPDPVPGQIKRWVVVAPPGSAESGLLLARAVGEEQRSRIGDQTGGRVFLFLHTDEFWRDFERLQDAGVRFVRPPVQESYGTVAVFEDLYGNLWDLIEPAG